MAFVKALHMCSKLSKLVAAASADGAGGLLSTYSFISRRRHRRPSFWDARQKGRGALKTANIAEPWGRRAYKSRKGRVIRGGSRTQGTKEREPRRAPRGVNQWGHQGV